jgi:fructokinase
MSAFADGADLIRMSDVDFDYLFGDDPYAARAESLLARGASLIVITRGTKGALGWHGMAGAIEVGTPSVEVVDTIGAGDSFHAALLFALREQGCLERAKLQAAGANELRRALSFACQCAAITCTRAGADPPRRNEVTRFW